MSTLDQLKKLRIAGKARFTRINNRVLKAIKEDNEAEYIDDIFKELTEAWRDLQAKHYNYVSLSDEDEQNEVWISEIEDTFSETKRLRICAQKIAQDKAIKNLKEDEICKTIELRKQSIDEAKRSRRLDEITFRQEADQWEAILDDELPRGLTAGGVKLAQKEFEIQFERCKASHRKFLNLLDEDIANKEIHWIVPLHKIYREISIKFEAFLEVQSEHLLKRSTASTGLRLEPMKMPRFEGEVRDYPRFKDDFERQVMPEMQNLYSAAYALRSCLSKDVLAIVKSVGDDITLMWERLDDEYGDVVAVADTIINEISRFRPLKDGENQRFIEFVAVIEAGYRDLKRLNMEANLQRPVQ